MEVIMSLKNVILLYLTSFSSFNFGMIQQQRYDTDILAQQKEIKHEYAGALSKVKLFPVAFSLRGMGESSETDSLMRIFEEQIRSLIRGESPCKADSKIIG